LDGREPSVLLLPEYAEFSDYSLEGFGWPSGRTRLDCRPNALCQHTNFKRGTLDKSNEMLGRARPLNWTSSQIRLCCGTILRPSSRSGAARPQGSMWSSSYPRE
jgi:hypothetical protein